MMRQFPILSSIVAAALAFQPAGAAEAPGDGQAGANEAVCSALSTEGRVALVLPLPAKQIARLQAKGMIVEPCDGLELTAAAFPDKICAFASKAPADTQRLFIQAYKITPDELCSLTKEIPYAPKAKTRAGRRNEKLITR